MKRRGGERDRALAALRRLDAHLVLACVEEEIESQFAPPTLPLVAKGPRTRSMIVHEVPAALRAER